MSTLIETIKAVASKFSRFTERGGGMTMRFYQLEPAQAILRSIQERRGDTIVLIISRQAGKDELLSNLLPYLLMRFINKEAEIVLANPTYKPQTLKFMLRLESRLKTNLLTKKLWRKRGGFMYQIGRALLSLLSGDTEARVVGSTASLLLVINEAQDILPAKYDKDFAPMVASTNATRVIVGTEWTNTTLLAREEDAALAAEAADGIRRVFKYTSDDVRKVNAEYGTFVDGEVAKLGRQHPLVKTQYFCERIDAIAGMFNAQRLALMTGDQLRQSEPIPGHVYAFVIDVAGQDEAILELEGMRNPGRDKTTLRIIDIDLSELETLQAPIYRPVLNMDWHGTNHVSIFGAICATADTWQPLYIVIDATGAGEGLWGMLTRKYGELRVIGFKYTGKSKSELGYGFLAIIEAGRYRDCARTEEIQTQYRNCQSEILIGPAKTMRWGVPDGTRDPNTGLLVHDDYVTADALTVVLDSFEWYIPSETIVIDQPDALKEMDHAY